MQQPDSIDLILLGPPRLDGAAQRNAVWRRARAHRALKDCAAAVLFGPLTAHGRTIEAAPLSESSAVFTSRLSILPGPSDMPQQGSAPGWLTRLTADTTPTRPIALGDGRTTLIPLDTLRLGGGRDAIGAHQLAALEQILADRAPGARTILALNHDPHGKPADGRGLADRDALGRILKQHPVALIAHGQRSGFGRGRFAGVPTVAPPPIDGCAVTGWRALVRVRWGADGDEPRIEPLHVARPVDRPALAETFAVAHAAEAWTALAEKIVAADDTFAAIAAEMRARALRLDHLTEHGAALDGALADLIRRAGGEP